MQLSEGASSGETGNDSDGDCIPYIPEQADNLPPVFAEEATLYLNAITSTNDNEALISDYKLNQNYPNPFNPNTVISYELPENNYVTIKIYNLLGSEVATLMNGYQTSGAHKVTFNASSSGSRLASGIYLYKIQAGNFASTKKLMLLK